MLLWCYFAAVCNDFSRVIFSHRLKSVFCFFHLCFLPSLANKRHAIKRLGSVHPLTALIHGTLLITVFFTPGHLLM